MGEWKINRQVWLFWDEDKLFQVQKDLIGVKETI